MYEKKRIYIVVKTYPTISEKYSELVCTAGILEDGSWVRLYPIPFRLLKDEQKYPKYSWIEVEIERNLSDFRPESYRPNIETLTVQKSQGKDKRNVNWEERSEIIFKNQKTYTNLSELIAQKKEYDTSLAIFKPTKIIDFIVEHDSREWDPKKIVELIAKSKQLDMTKSIDEIQNEFKLVEKVPYKFSYKFEDDSGRQSTLMIEDWEIGMLYFNCLNNSQGREEIAIAKVKEKYFYDFVNKRDLHFFLGTTAKHHKVSRNPFIIIGVYYPPKQLHPQIHMEI